MRNRIISILAGTAAVLTASASAFAADMGVKAPPPTPSPVYNWTGWYAGVNIGASFGTVKTDFNTPITVQSTVGAASGGFTFPIAGSDTWYPASVIGGGQVGYNWQFSPLLVMGLEADFQGADAKHNNTFTGNYSSGLGGLPPEFFVNGQPVTAIGSITLNYQTKIEWFGTVRGRVGYLWGNGAVLTYVTGGLAYGKVDLEGTNTVTGQQSNTPFTISVTQAFGHSQVNAGWVVGTGTEGKLLIPGWTYKIEGLYMDLGALDVTGASVSTTSAPFNSATNTLAAGPITTHTRFTDAIIRAGLNYQFH
jgi:outer membrane immunogenic protein